MKRDDEKILRLLIESDEEMSMQRIATLLGKDYKNTHESIRRLEQEGNVVLQRFGRAYKIILNKRPHILLYEAEHTRREQALRNKELAAIRDGFKSLRTTLYVILLFGSHAKKVSTKNSDIDLLFIIPDSSKLEDSITRAAKLIPRPLHITIVTESEFKAMKNSNEFTIGQEAMKHNIILHGIEAYYEMLE